MRLVGGQLGIAAHWGASVALPADNRVADVATENRRAATNPELRPTDPRWVLAARAYSQLQGTTLTPERRRRVLKIANQLGVRPFDASVIIAIVQDHARTGRALSDAGPTLQLLHEPNSTQSSPYTMRWMAALTAAAAINFLLIWWVLSGT